MNNVWFVAEIRH